MRRIWRLSLALVVAGPGPAFARAAAPVEVRLAAPIAPVSPVPGSIGAAGAFAPNLTTLASGLSDPSPLSAPALHAPTPLPAAVMPVRPVAALPARPAGSAAAKPAKPGSPAAHRAPRTALEGLKTELNAPEPDDSDPIAGREHAALSFETKLGQAANPETAARADSAVKTGRPTILEDSGGARPSLKPYKEKTARNPRPEPGAVRRIVLPLAYAAFLVPAISIIHELGHYTAARLFGRPAKLRLQQVEIADIQSLSHLKQAIINFAGPFANLLLAGALIGLNALVVTNPAFLAVNSFFAAYNVILFTTNLTPVGPRTFLAKLLGANGKETDGYHLRENWRNWRQSRKGGAKGPTREKIARLDLRGKVKQEPYEDLEDRLEKIAGRPEDLAVIKAQTKKVIALERRFDRLTAEDMKAKTGEFRERLKRGETLDDLLPEAFALAREAMARALGKKPYVEQIAAGIGIHMGRINQQKTGEGKTLSIGLAAYLNALQGSVDVYTFNGYLALRDADEIGHVLALLGMKVGAFQDKKQAYLFSGEQGHERDDYNGNLIRYAPADLYREADVIYGFNGAFIFDYLHDYTYDSARQFTSKNRRKNFAIIDEADAELLEEANTNFRIVVAESDPFGVDYPHVYRMVQSWKDGEYFTIDANDDVRLTSKGRNHLLSLKDVSDYFKNVKHLAMYTTNALKAMHTMKLNEDYVIMKDKIVILDLHTGRLQWSRVWGGGLHRFLEIKEGLIPGKDQILISHIALSHYMGLYRKVSGITGTIGNSDDEFAQVYSLPSLRFPSHRASVREDHPDMLFATYAEKISSLIDDAIRASKANQPVLIGTGDLSESILIGGLLKKRGAPFTILNGAQEQSENEIIKNAGTHGAITVATQLAGRGTDIVPDGVALAAGGLHVLLTEKTDSKRVDDQLRGRAGRQGNPGSSRQYVSLEDKLLGRFAADEEVDRLKEYLAGGRHEIQDETVAAVLNAVQMRAESSDVDGRTSIREKDLLVHPLRSLYFNLRDGIFLGRTNRNLAKFGISSRDVTYFNPLKKRYALNALQEGWKHFINEYEDLWKMKNGDVSAEELEALFRTMVLRTFKDKIRFLPATAGWIRVLRGEIAGFLNGSWYQTVGSWMTNKFLNVNYYYGRAKAADRRKKFEKAAGYYTEVLNLNPQDAEVYFDRGMAYLNLNDDEAAVRDFTNSLKLDYGVVTGGSSKDLAFKKKAIDKLSVIFHNRALRREHSGDQAGAALNYRIALELAPGETNMKALRRARQRLDKRGFGLMRADFPFLKYVYLYKAREAVDQEHYGNAAYYFNRVLAIDPMLATAHFGRGWSYEQQGRYEEARADKIDGLRHRILRSQQFIDIRSAYRKLFSASLDQGSIPSFENMHALFASRADKPWKSVSKQDELQADAAYRKGNSLLEQERWEEALPHYDAALRLNPYLAAAYDERGAAHEKLGDHAQAIKDLVNGLKYGTFAADGIMRQIIAGQGTRYDLALDRAEIDRFFAEFSDVLTRGEAHRQGSYQGAAPIGTN